MATDITVTVTPDDGEPVRKHYRFG